MAEGDEKPEDKSKLKWFGIPGAFVGVGLVIWAGVSDAVKDEASATTKTVIESSEKQIKSLFGVHDSAQDGKSLTDGKWYLAVYYDKTFDDVSLSGRGHPAVITLTAEPELTGTYQNDNGTTGLVTGFERGERLIISYANAAGESAATAIVQDVGRSAAEKKQKYVGAIFIYACNLANEQRCDNKTSQFKFCRAILSRNPEPEKDPLLKAYFDRPCTAFANDLDKRLDPIEQK
ncbi:hypothetical protein [Mesorhizobium sp. M00.F.Ca.ET.217.01.1.1]|uniref:hypothetical protein n=1 Tax=Mesorhizobium sp. M00.F.Ca.ET.217.01.1.1 TaxID=2500529 RepID=UPI000FDA5B8A|nr:hypothetical protein [Mesorhizobium sp. M00.F.Ca.ET.217.01.1.1]TGQ13586.1 hypothetical protein EN860_030610 [Mesorhizobium sp. M00.F.Ca.ET.217.01.1.1]TGV85450.1 hypothetical protein EN801_029315 [Mesorhizobium sp. M00.F.Ca.ET.158.01.1.1]